jgi:hypothetical protein
VALAIAFRLALLAARPLWSDELFTVWVARMAPAPGVSALRNDSGPPGFYAFVKPFVALGEITGDDRAVRVLSFLAALALLFAARALPSRGARRAALVLFGTSALLGLYAAEGRAYALLALLIFLLFREALEAAERPRQLAAVGALGAAALYTHYLALPAVAVLLLLALARRRIRTAAALAISGLFFAPWIPILAAQPPGAVAWMREPPAASAVGFLSSLGGAGRVPAPFGFSPPDAVFALGIAAALLLTMAVVRAASADAAIRDAAIFVAAVLVLSLAASLVMPFAFAGRTEMAVLPVWLWAVARASAASRLARAGVAVSAVLGILTLGAVAAGPHPPSAAGRASRVVDRLARPGDTLFAGPGFYLPFRIAADRGRLAPRLVAYPSAVARHPGWWTPEAPSGEDVAAVATAVAGPGAVWLLVPPGFVTPEIRAALAAGGRVRELSMRPEAVLLHRAAAGEGARP